MPFALAARLDPEWGVLLSDDSFREIVETSCLELHEFRAWGVWGVQSAVPHWAVSWCWDVTRVGWDVGVLFFFVLGLVFFVFRIGIIRGECDTVWPRGLVICFVGFGVDGCLSTGSDHCNWVQSVGGRRCLRVWEGAGGSFFSSLGFRFDFGLCRPGRCICPPNVAVRVGDVRRVSVLGVWGVKIFGVSYGLGFRGGEIFVFFRVNVWRGEWRGFVGPRWFHRSLHILRR